MTMYVYGRSKANTWTLVDGSSEVQGVNPDFVQHVDLAAQHVSPSGAN